MKWRGGNKGKTVIAYDLEGNIIGRYPSTWAAALETGFSQNTISEECLGNTKRPHKNRTIRYKYEENT